MLAQMSTPTVVVRLPNWIGDVCMVLPSLKLLAQTGVPLIICGKPFAQTLLHGLPHQCFVPLTGRAWPDSRVLRHTLKKSLSGHPTKPKFLGLLYPDSMTSALTFWLAGIASIGYRDDGRRLFLKWPIHKPAIRDHAVIKWYFLTCQAINTWQLPHPQPLPSRPDFYQYVPSEDDRRRAQQLMHQFQLTPGNYVLIAPTATGRHKGQVKVWPHFAELAATLTQRGIRVVSCPPAHERQQAEQAAPSAQVLDALPLGAFIQLALDAKLVICNDSGVSHLSAIAGAPQLTLFGVTDPDHTGPWSEHAGRLGQAGHWPSLHSVLLACEPWLASFSKPPSVDNNPTTRLPSRVT